METARFHRNRAELCLVMAGQMSDPLAAIIMGAAAARHSERADELENPEVAPCGARVAGAGRRCDMCSPEIAPSHLPSLILPCPSCGRRMAIVGMEPAPLPSGRASNDLKDVTHGCSRCGALVIRTVRAVAAA
jgi:hypothetical protein